MINNSRQIEEDLRDASTWNVLTFGTFSSTIVQRAVADKHWQTLRASLLGTPLGVKFHRLHCYLDSAAELGDGDELQRRRIRVTNYVNALKRGGLIK